MTTLEIKNLHVSVETDQGSNDGGNRQGNHKSHRQQSSEKKMIEIRQAVQCTSGVGHTEHVELEKGSQTPELVENRRPFNGE